MTNKRMEGNAFAGLIRLLGTIAIVCAICLPMWVFFFGSPLVMFGWGVPNKVISFGYARPVSCEKKKFIDAYECVLRNHQDSFRRVRLACGSFDAEGRPIDSAYRISAAYEIEMTANQERIVGIPYKDGAETIICSDTDTVYMYSSAMSLLKDPEARDISSVLNLNKFSGLFDGGGSSTEQSTQPQARHESKNDSGQVIEDKSKENNTGSMSHENSDPCSRLESNFQRTELPMAERVSLMRELVDCRREHPEPDAASASEPSQAVDSSASKQQGQQESIPYVEKDVEDVAGDEVMNEENDGPIVAVLQEMPKYPPAAMRAGITGTVVVEVTVGANGDVDSASIHSSSNNRDLDRAALQAARRWKYSKSRNGGILRVPVNFGYGQVSSPTAGVATNHTSCPSEDIRGFVQKFRDSIPIQRSYTISGFSHTSLDENLEQITEVKSSAEIDFPVMVSNKETSGLTVDFSVRGRRATVHEQGIDSGVSATYVFEKREGCWYLVSLEDLST